VNSLLNFTVGLKGAAALLLLLLSLTGFSPELRAQADCDAGALISETFNNGARWEMCWESRIRENLVLSDVHYTNPEGTTKRILGSARLSQLHVAYDDSDVTYNDITQYGLGGGYLVQLSERDCPFGELLYVQTRPAVCKWRTNENDSYRTATRSVNAESLTLFSVSQVGAYAYVGTWKFYSDGAIEPQIGATGALQRNSENLELPFGRLLSGDTDTLWLSHTHNYYWRLDFDLGDSATDDVVTESRTVLLPSGQKQAVVEKFTTEQSRKTSMEYPMSWEIWDKLATASPTATDSGYRIEPVHYGHRVVREDIEPYTEFDFFVTTANECERFASQNARFNPDCLNNVAQYANNESLVDADLVVWHRVSFHHVPRNEDQRNMHTHWDGFTIEPVNLHASTPGIDVSNNTAPQLAAIANRENAIGDSINWQLSATDNDGDALQYIAEGLPAGLSISGSGRVQGNTSQAGSFNVAIKVTDDIALIERRFNWSVGGASGGKSGSSFFGSVDPLLLIMLLAVGKYRRFYL